MVVNPNEEETTKSEEGCSPPSSSSPDEECYASEHASDALDPALMNNGTDGSVELHQSQQTAEEVLKLHDMMMKDAVDKVLSGGVETYEQFMGGFIYLGRDTDSNYSRFNGVCPSVGISLESTPSPALKTKLAVHSVGGHVDRGGSPASGSADRNSVEESDELFLEELVSDFLVNVYSIILPLHFSSFLGYSSAILEFLIYLDLLK